MALFDPSTSCRLRRSPLQVDEFAETPSFSSSLARCEDVNHRLSPQLKQHQHQHQQHQHQQQQGQKDELVKERSKLKDGSVATLSTTTDSSSSSSSSSLKTATPTTTTSTNKAFKDPRHQVKKIMIRVIRKSPEKFKPTNLADVILSSMRENLLNEEVQLYCLQQMEEVLCSSSRSDTTTTTNNNPNMTTIFVSLNAQEDVKLAMMNFKKSKMIQTAGCSVRWLLLSLPLDYTTNGMAGVCQQVHDELFRMYDSSSDDESNALLIVELAMTTLCLLSDNQEGRLILEELDISQTVVQTMRYHLYTSELIQQDGCTVLANIVQEKKDPQSMTSKATIAELQAVIRAMVQYDKKKPCATMTTTESTTNTMSLLMSEGFRALKGYLYKSENLLILCQKDPSILIDTPGWTTLEAFSLQSMDAQWILDKMMGTRTKMTTSSTATTATSGTSCPAVSINNKRVAFMV